MPCHSGSRSLATTTAIATATRSRSPPELLRAGTIHAAAQAAGVPALCVTAKDKLRRLLADGDVPAFSAERAHEQSLPDGTPLLDVAGAPNPGIYDWRLSIYTIDLALALARRLGSRLVYASLTDFVQHAAAPGEPLSDDFHRELDGAIGRALDAGYILGVVAHHGMNARQHRTAARTSASWTTRWAAPA